MESTPKKATEKIGGELRKKLPKKSVGLADCQNGLLYRGSEGREPDCQIGSPVSRATDRMADPSGGGSAKISNFLAVRHLGFLAIGQKLFFGLGTNSFRLIANELQRFSKIIEIFY